VNRQTAFSARDGRSRSDGGGLARAAAGVGGSRTGLMPAAAHTDRGARRRHMTVKELEPRSDSMPRVPKPPPGDTRRTYHQRTGTPRLPLLPNTQLVNEVRPRPPPRPPPSFLALCCCVALPRKCIIITIRITASATVSIVSVIIAVCAQEIAVKGPPATVLAGIAFYQTWLCNIQKIPAALFQTKLRTATRRKLTRGFICTAVAFRQVRWVCKLHAAGPAHHPPHLVRDRGSIT
jgi:hypothetical protein